MTMSRQLYVVIALTAMVAFSASLVLAETQVEPASSNVTLAGKISCPCDKIHHDTKCNAKKDQKCFNPMCCTPHNCLCRPNNKWECNDEAIHYPGYPNYKCPKSAELKVESVPAAEQPMVEPASVPVLAASNVTLAGKISCPCDKIHHDTKCNAKKDQKCLNPMCCTPHNCLCRPNNKWECSSEAIHYPGYPNYKCPKSAEVKVESVPAAEQPMVEPASVPVEAASNVTLAGKISCPCDKIHHDTKCNVKKDQKCLNPMCCTPHNCLCRPNNKWECNDEAIHYPGYPNYKCPKSAETKVESVPAVQV